MFTKKYFLAIDTETTGTIGKPLVYDVGFGICDLEGNFYEKRSYVNYDIYCKERELMKSAYYADKLPQYEADLANGSRKFSNTYNIRKEILFLMEKYHVEGVLAYNTSFDRRALNNTLAHVTEGKYRYFFPRNTKFFDAWTMACSSIFSNRLYRAVAYENGWYSEKGNVRTNAEVAFAYISKDYNFTECHTALEDVEIEVMIMAYCWRKTKPEQREIIGCPWRIPQKEWYYSEYKRDRV